MNNFTYSLAVDLLALIEIVHLDPPAALVRGIHLAEKLMEVRAPKTESVLALADDELEEYLGRQAVRVAGYSGSPNAVATAWDEVAARAQTDLFGEVRFAMLSEVDELIAQMADPFNTAGGILTAHMQAYGFTSATQAEEIIDRDAATIAAFRELPGLLQAIRPFAALRTLLSTSLDLGPTISEREMLGYQHGWIPEDWSILFAAGDLWSIDGHLHLNGSAQGSIDWLRLAAGGLHMNSVDEVRAKITARQQDLWKVTTNA